MCLLQHRIFNGIPILPFVLRTWKQKGQVDVFPLVLVSADNINVSAVLNTDLFMKIWVGQLYAAEPKAANDS